MATETFHPYLLTCPLCEKAVAVERVAFSAEARMEVMGMCTVCDSLVREEAHVIEVVAKAAALDATGKESGLLIHRIATA